MEKKQNIFDKLTNPALYTGAHKERFDKDGKGKGLAGRVDEVGQKDLKTMVDSKSKGSSTTNDKVSSSNKEVKEVTSKLDKVEIKDEPKKQNIFDKLTNPALYTGAHKERFDKDGKGKGISGRVDEVAPKDLKTMVDSKSKSSTITNNTNKVNSSTSNKIVQPKETKEEPKKQNIFDKLTNPDLYTGAHKERFDKDGKGKGLAGRKDNTGPKELSGMVSVKK